jgi:hypothetical protein
MTNATPGFGAVFLKENSSLKKNWEIKGAFSDAPKIMIRQVRCETKIGAYRFLYKKIKKHPENQRFKTG